VPRGAVEILLLTIYTALLFVRVMRGDNLAAGLRRIPGSLAAMAVVYGMLGFVPKLYFSSGLQMSGRYLVFFLIAVAKSADIGAYFVGTMTAARRGGNHKLAPRVSPKKSWEGLLGGMAVSILVALVIVSIFWGRLALPGGRALALGDALLLAVVFALLGLLGDLAESVLKRVADIKDSGKVPGLGGILDLTDSLIFTAPFFYAYLYIWG
jgi:phosphatidate cytidylyltransferase